MVFVESGVEILSGRAAAMLSCREADDDEAKKEKRRDDQDDLTLTYIFYQVLPNPSSYEYTSLHTNRPEILGITENIPRISQKSQQR